MVPNRYNLLLIGFTLLLLAIVGAFSAVVDPYDVIGMTRIAGFNAIKPDTGLFTGLIKPYQVERVRPVTLLLGSSRTHLGLDADSAVWPDAMKPVYNYGLPGQGMPMAERAYYDSVSLGRVKRAILLLDFEVFIYAEPLPPEPGEEERRLLLGRNRQPNPARPWQQAQDLLSVTLSARALIDSIDTVLAQHRASAGNITPLGTNGEGEFRRAAEADGFGALFLQKDETYAKRLMVLAQIAARQSGEMPGMPEVRRMLAFSKEHGIAFDVVIPPIHADLLELYDHEGLWPRFEAWKRDLAAAVRDNGDSRAVLWDFSDYDAYGTEPVPALTARRQMMRWFWEPVHFRKETGDLMLQRILGAGGPDGFGAVLTPQNVDARNAAVRRARDAFRAAHPDAVARIANLVAQARGR